MKRLLCFVCLLQLCAFSDTSRFRIVWQQNPESEATVMWQQVNGSNPVLHYGKLDHGEDYTNYEFSKSPNRRNFYKGMENKIVDLTGLEPDTNYYFVVKDGNSVSERLYFRTAPATKKPFKYVQGGDSRNNRNVRQDCNLMVSKIRPLFVSFGGDMTDDHTESQWKAWLDDWQLTITADGRIFPIIPVEGNHESADDCERIFGIKNLDTVYKVEFANNLFSLYLLNSEINMGGSQSDFLESDLNANYGKYTFISASYHKPMRPHHSGKSEGNDVYNAFAQIFYNYKVDLLAENDSHCVKRTEPVRPFTGPGSDEGFIAAADGYVKIGEGTWGAPLRDANDRKDWTIGMAKFNGFDLIHVDTDKMEIRTVRVSDSSGRYVNQASALTELDDVFALPAGIEIWDANGSASGGKVQTITPKDRSGIEIPVVETVFSYGATWKYYDKVSAPPSNWKSLNFDDSSWDSGRGELGYGDGDERTVLSFGGDSNNKITSYYFRKEINIDDLSNVTGAELKIKYDDGAVVYVNGQQVRRVNMPTGTVTHNTFAKGSGDSSVTFAFNHELLNTGKNVIAVSIHQKDLDSSDISFDGGLNFIITESEEPEPSDSKKQTVVNLSVSDEQAGNPGTNVLDGDLNTRWSSNQNGASLTLEFAEVITLSTVKVAAYNGNSRVAFFDIETSADGTGWTSHGSFKTSGTSLALEDFDVTAGNVKYVRIIGGGNSSNSWNSFTEVEVWGASASPEKQIVTNLSVSDEQSGNPGTNVIDGNLNTRWSSNQNGASLTLEFAEVITLSTVKVAAYNGNSRVAFFDIETSADGTDWTSHGSFETSGTSLALEDFDVTAANVKYVRIIGGGNSSNTWNSFTEVEVWGTR